MGSPSAPREIIKKIRTLGAQIPRLSDREIARQLRIDHSTVSKYRNQTFAECRDVTAVDIRKALRSGPLNVAELAETLHTGHKEVAIVVAQMKKSGALLMEFPDGRLDLISSVNLETRTHEVKGERGEWTHVFGFVTDNHLCNKHSRLDVLNSAYDHFERSGITRVFNAGNWIDGEARFNKTELVTSPGMDRQLDYMIDVYPHRKGIVTHYIAGDDHEGWYQQREGVEVGHYLQMRAQAQGRTDLKYLGYAEADIGLKFGTGAAVMRVVHPGGGSAYAISYTDQKRAESYQGGEKPHVELVGHYHKWNHGYPREIHTVQGGCTCDQTMFMRKKRLQAHVGFSVVKIKQRQDGAIERFAAEWFPFYDRKFYEQRF
jgi:hypothetical protein